MKLLNDRERQPEVVRKIARRRQPHLDGTMRGRAPHEKSPPDLEEYGVVPTRVGEIMPFDRDLGLRGRVLRVGWELSPNLSEEEWREAGALLGKIDRGLLWWVGDWWRHGERYGRRAEVVSADAWDGPSHKTCRNAAVVCEAFDVSRRRDTLSFSHHAEVAALPSAEADALLDWAEEPVAATGKPRSTRELRREVAKLRPAAPSDIAVEPDPPPDPEPPDPAVDDIEMVATAHRQATLPGLDFSQPSPDPHASADQRRTASGRAGKARHRVERELIAYLAALGVSAEQVPMSDVPVKLLSPEFGDDLQILIFGPDPPPATAEAKARAKAGKFGLLERWLGDHDRLILRQNGLRSMIVLSRETWERLLAGVWAP